MDRDSVNSLGAKVVKNEGFICSPFTRKEHDWIRILDLSQF
jgi:hypothetical protein